MAPVHKCLWLQLLLGVLGIVVFCPKLTFSQAIFSSQYNPLIDLFPKPSGPVSPNAVSLSADINSRLAKLQFNRIDSQLNVFRQIAALEEFPDFLFANVNPVCANHSKHVLEEISGYKSRLPETWAMQMLDSWGKFPTSGILSGHVQVPGDFHECLQVRGKYMAAHSLEDGAIKGQYCATYIVPGPRLLNQSGSPSGHSSLQEIDPGLRDSVDFLTLLEYMLQTSQLVMFPMMGTCFPASCSAEEVQAIFSSLYTVATKDYLSQSVVACYTDEKPPLDAGDYSMIIILAIIAWLCTIGTIIDHFNVFGGALPKDGTLRKTALAFSLKTNTIKWLGTRAGSDNLGCLHGLRFLSMSWVVLGHTLLMFSIQPTWNLVDMKQLHQDWSMFLLLNGTFAVDTFLTMSGALVVYNLLRELDKRKGQFNYFMFAIHRILRITPTYAILLGIMATVLPYLGSGPGWFAIEIESRNCESSWWHNILYLNNFLSFGPDGKPCYGEAWYLGNDMQFYLLSPLVVLPLWKWKRIGFGILAVLSVTSMVVPGVITYAKELPPQPIVFIDQKSYTNDVYVKPYTRCGPYIAGMILGYILYLRSKSPSKFRNLSLPAVVLGWAACTVLALALIFGIIQQYDPENYDMTIHSWHSHLYSGTHYFLWGVVISWIIFACVCGYGSWVNSFLSWKVFMPLGRLTFCMYVTSYHLQVIYHSSQPVPGYYSNYNVVNLFFAHLLMSGLVSYLLTMTLESPFMQLEKILFTPTTKPKPSAAVKLEEQGDNSDSSAPAKNGYVA